MNQRALHEHWLTWLSGAMAAFVVGLIAGVGILGLRLWAVGHSDPFRDGWPLYLQISSLVSTLAIGWLLRRPFSAALGLYSGLVIYMLASGESSYPVSACIALAVHGLAPALMSAFVVFTILVRSRSLARQSSATSRALHRLDSPDKGISRGRRMSE